MRTVKKQMLYRVRTIVAGEIFGHEEFIRHDDPTDPSIRREYRVKSLVHSEIMYIKKLDFINCKSDIFLTYVKI